MSFTLDQILGLAPDDASAKAAKGLAAAAKWPLLGRTDAALWGECQGSGTKPYQVQADLSGPAFRCSCPSRKFPCKHGLALLLLSVQKPDAFAHNDPPAWVAEWLASRQQRTAKQEEKQAAAPATDPQAAAKRANQRLAQMTAGADDLRRWLADQVRHGLGSLVGAERDLRALAARMVDAKAPGLAFRVQQLAEILAAGGDWPPRLLAAMGRLHLLLDAVTRYAELPPLVQADIRAALGWSLGKDEVLTQGERLADTWDILGCVITQNERLWERRVWLRGRESGRYALLLDHAHGNPVFEPTFLVGGALHAPLAFYPSHHPRRALLAESPIAAGSALFPRLDHDHAWTELASSLAAQPWQTPLPLTLGAMLIQRDAGGWSLCTPTRGQLPTTLSDPHGWLLLALSGGLPLNLFGEWDGERLRPLSAWTDTLIWSETSP